MRSHLSVWLLGGRSMATHSFISAALGAFGATIAPPDTEVDIDAAVVVVDVDERVGPLVELSDGDWGDAVDRPLAELLDALQDARSALLARGGAVVVVVPTIGIPGARNLVPLTTVVEGARSMAKSAARQWAAEGIAVNMLALPLGVLIPALDNQTKHVPVASGPLPGPTEVAPILETFLRSTTAITGATVVADGGSVMVP